MWLNYRKAGMFGELSNQECLAKKFGKCIDLIITITGEEMDGFIAFDLDCLPNSVFVLMDTFLLHSCYGVICIKSQPNLNPT